MIIKKKSVLLDFCSERGMLSVSCAICCSLRITFLSFFSSFFFFAGDLW